MTKAEFGEQFKRLRVAGYRLPVFDGVKVNDVIDEWYGTFGSCSKEELSAAIDKLKQTKTDTFWPATGELWAMVYEVRKARRIRQQTQGDGSSWSMSDADATEFLSLLRQCKERIVTKMTMPKVSDAIGQQEAADHELLADEDRRRAAEGDVCG